MGIERRRDDRIDTHFQLACRVPARPRWAIVHDLSHIGCRLEFRDVDVEVGGTVVLEPPSVRQIPGRVVWTHGKQAGVEFDRRLTGTASVVLGLDEPEPEVVEEAPAEDRGLTGLLRHWMRRLTGRLG